MAQNEPNVQIDRTRGWRFWRWWVPPYRGRRDRLSPEAQGQAANYNMRAGR